MLKTLVITSCTGEKKYHPDNQLLQKDFTSVDLNTREEELKEYACKASEMYTGMQHLRLMEGINALRQKFGKGILDLYVVSAGYGLINEDKEIVPYEVTFNTMNASGINEWSKQIKIHQSLDQIINEYDLVFFLLGDKYLRAVDLPLNATKENQKLLVFASGTSKKMVPNVAPYYFIEVGQEDAKSFSYGLVGLKGFLFKLLSQDIISSDGKLLEQIYGDPSLIMSSLDKYRKKKEEEPLQMNIFGGYDSMAEKSTKTKKEKKESASLLLPQSEWAKNYTGHLTYFIPEWDDRVDPNYDFITDTSPEGRDTYIDDVYAHEIYEKPNYDGVLMSKIIVEGSKKKKKMIEQVGVHEFIRFDKDKPMMGDCGAFGYVDEYEPPYETDEILDYYQNLGFNIGVSIDHLIVGKYAEDLAEREDITLLKRMRKSSLSIIKREIIHSYLQVLRRDGILNRTEMQ